MPPEERPRQRLLRSGGEALSDAEILSLVPGNGCREVCMLHLAREILAEAGSLGNLVGAQPEVLQRRGLGEAKAAALLATLELARRLADSELPQVDYMGDPGLVARYLVLRYALRDQDVMGSLYLNKRHRLVGEREFFRGA
jgi:DNA repair protein RadC